MSLISVVIPTRNRSALLKQAIESVLQVQRTGFDLEIIVVDDGSSDDTADVAGAFPVVYLHANGLGASGARNLGMQAAHGEYLAFLDDDDMYLPQNIAAQLSLLESNPAYGAVFAQATLIDSAGVPFGAPFPYQLKSGWMFNELLGCCPQIGTLVVRRAVVEEIGYLDTTLQSAEDWDWFLRMARRYRIGFVERPVILFRQRGLGNEKLMWFRFPITVRVFRHHTRHCKLFRRLGVQRILWARRGWYASVFVGYAQEYMRRGDAGSMLRCLGYAVRSSPAHTGLTLTKQFITRGAHYDP